MQKIRMGWWEKTKEEEEIAQEYSSGLEYAFASMNKQCMPFIYCKDFLHDVVWAMVHNKPIKDIYGFRFYPAVNPIPLDLTRILIANSSDEFFAEKIPNVIDFLNQIEQVLKLKKTVAFECENAKGVYDNGVFLLVGSQRWLNSPPMLSLYSLLIRIGFVHTVGADFIETMNGIENDTITPYQENDKEYLTDARPAIDAILAIGYRKIFYKKIEKNYPRKLDKETLHHNFGIQGYTWGEIKEFKKRWYRDSIIEALREKGIDTSKLWVKPVKNVSIDALDDGAFKEIKSVTYTSDPYSFVDWNKGDKC